MVNKWHFRVKPGKHMRKTYHTSSEILSFAAHLSVREAWNCFLTMQMLRRCCHYQLWVSMLPDNLLLSQAFAPINYFPESVCAECVLLMKSSTVVHAQSIIHGYQKAQCLVAPQFQLSLDPSCSVKVGHNWIFFRCGRIVQNIPFLNLATADLTKPAW